MRKTIKLILIVFGLVVVSVSSFAQVTASANATATIVTPITIAKVTDMNFGNIAVQSGVGGTVTLSASATPTRTPGGAGGVTLPAVTGTVQSALFDINGTPNYTFAITLPSTALTITSGLNTMLVDLFTSSPSPTGALNGSGYCALYVGATVNVGAGQAPGIYTSQTPFDVTVNYN